MSEEFSIDFGPLSRDFGNEIERATLADVKICINQTVATELEDEIAKTVRKSARLSLYNLALWFASNWWRIRWEPEGKTSDWLMSHNIGAAGGGYVWPNLAFASDGTFMNVQGRATTPLPYQPIRYLRDFELVIKADEFEKTIDRFLEAVIARLSSSNLSSTELQTIWNEVLTERQIPEQARWRKLEAILGFDPDSGPESLIEELQSAMLRYGTSAIEEISASSKESAVSDLNSLLVAADRASPPIRISNFEDIIRKIEDTVPPTDLPWQKATKAARIARMVWSIEPGPVENDLLSSILAFPIEWVNATRTSPKVPLPAGFRVPARPDEVKAVFRRRHPASRRFELARMVGDHLVARRDEKILPVTDSKTERQKFQRAFAQELLCPFVDLIEFLPSNEPEDEEIEDAAAYFQVSPLMIRTMLVNKGKMDRDTLTPH